MVLGRSLCINCENETENSLAILNNSIQNSGFYLDLNTEPKIGLQLSQPPNKIFWV